MKLHDTLRDVSGVICVYTITSEHSQLLLVLIDPIMMSTWVLPSYVLPWEGNSNAAEKLV